MYFYKMGGHLVDQSKDINFKAAFLPKLVQGAPLKVHVSANFMFVESGSWSSLPIEYGYECDGRISVHNWHIHRVWL